MNNPQYELASLEEAENFEKQRNYTYTWNGVSQSVSNQWDVNEIDIERTFEEKTT